MKSESSFVTPFSDGEEIYESLGRAFPQALVCCLFLLPRIAAGLENILERVRERNGLKTKTTLVMAFVVIFFLLSSFLLFLFLLPGHAENMRGRNASRPLPRQPFEYFLSIPSPFLLHELRHIPENMRKRNNNKISEYI